MLGRQERSRWAPPALCLKLQHIWRGAEKWTPWLRLSSWPPLWILSRIFMRNLHVIRGHSAHIRDPGTALLMKAGFSVRDACHKELLGIPALSPWALALVSANAFISQQEWCFTDAHFPKMSPPFSHVLVATDGQDSEGQFVADRKTGLQCYDFMVGSV